MWLPCPHEHEGALHEMTSVDYGGQRACVDVGVASLILWLWKLGAVTRYSCESGQRGADVSFLHAADLERAYGALRELVREDPCLFHRASGTRFVYAGKVQDHEHSEDTLWSFEVWQRIHVQMDMVPFGEEAEHAGLLNYRMTIPVADLPAVTRLIESTG